MGQKQTPWHYMEEKDKSWALSRPPSIMKRMALHMSQGLPPSSLKSCYWLSFLLMCTTACIYQVFVPSKLALTQFWRTFHTASLSLLCSKGCWRVISCARLLYLQGRIHAAAGGVHWRDRPVRRALRHL